MAGKYNILTLNCNGLRHNIKRRTIFQFLKLKKVNISILQETHVEDADVVLWEQEWNVGTFCANPGTRASAGQLVLTSKHVRVLQNISHIPGRLQEVIIQDHEYILRIFNVYGYNSEQLRVPFLQTLEKAINVVRESDFMCIGGDFNIILSNMLDKEGGNRRRLPSQIFLNNLLVKCKLIDTWRNENPMLKRFTWAQKKPSVKCRLDYFLVPKTNKKFVIGTKITSSVKTDHKCVELLIHIDKYKRGPGLWKINNDILNDSEYTNNIKTLIERVWRENNEQNLAVRYDYLKHQIRNETKKHCKIKAKQRNLKEKQLLIEIDQLELKQDQQQILTEEEKHTLLLKRQEIDSILQEKAKGAWVRSRIQYIEFHEKSTAFFHSLAKEKQEKHTISKLIIENTEIKDGKAILKELESFYTKLYTTQFNNNNVYESKIDPNTFTDITVLSYVDKECMERELTLSELRTSLQQFKNNKTPGCDGLSKEFYIAFWNEIGPKMLETFNYCKERKLLTQTQRRGVITLLQKKGKDATKIENYRPLSLLNVDYKILTKAIANRIQKHIGKVIHSDQLGFLKDRFIGEGVRKVEDIMEYCNLHGIEGCIVQLDFHKAFDSIEWPFLFNVLHENGFGNNIIEWIKICYTEIESCVLNSGFTSNWFQLLKGLRQGCPLSAYLFLLCIEILANKIRANPNITGVRTGLTEHKLSLFADDCTAMVRDPASIEELTREINKFTKYSGLRLNTNKSEIYPLNLRQMPVLQDTSFKLQLDDIKLLGITLGRNVAKQEQENITDKIVKMERTLNRWSQRHLSTIGKILVSKSHGVSKVIHTMSIKPISNPQLNKIQQTLNRFIWSNKPAKVKHAALCAPLNRGGLNALDVVSHYKAMRLPWLWRLLRSDNWNKVINMQLQDHGGVKLLMQSNYDKQTISSLPRFYKELFLFWSEIVCTTGQKEIIVWNNKHITISNKTIFVSSLYNNNIVYIHDFYDNEQPMTYAQFIQKHNVYIPARTYANIKRAINRYVSSNHRIFNMLQTEKPQHRQVKIQYKMLSGRTINITKCKCKDFYIEFVEKQIERPTALSNWQEDYQVLDSIFYSSLPLAISSTKETKLVAFQFKIIHNVVNHNSNLRKWGIKDTDRCDLCNRDEVDNTVHGFVTCPWTTRKIVEISVDLGLRDKFRQITKTEFLFGYDYNCLNNILLIIKYMLHTARHQNGVLSTETVRNEIFKRILSDSKTMKTHKFEEKWKNFNGLVAEAMNYRQILSL